MALQYVCIWILVIDKYIEWVMYRFNARCMNILIYLSVFYESQSSVSLIQIYIANIIHLTVQLEY